AAARGSPATRTHRHRIASAEIAHAWRNPIGSWEADGGIPKAREAGCSCEDRRVVRNLGRRNSAANDLSAETNRGEVGSAGDRRGNSRCPRTDADLYR